MNVGKPPDKAAAKTSAFPAFLWRPASRVQRLTRMAILVALSAVGAGIKIPALTGTPALDSAPGYFAALVWGSPEGPVIAGLGHLVTALTAGFPLTPLVHLLIAVGMAGCAWAVAALNRWRGITWAVPAGILLNGVAFPALFIPWPGYGLAFFSSMMVPLLVASALNLVLAALLVRGLAGVSADR